MIDTDASYAGKTPQQPAYDTALSRGGKFEAVVCFAIIFEMSFIFSSSKLSFTEGSSGSLPAQMLLLAMYVFSGIRLWQLRGAFGRIMQSALPLTVFLAITLLSAAVSTQAAASFKSGLELVGTTLVGAYIASRFTLSQFLKILALTFGTMAGFSALLVFGSPARGRMDWGAGSFNGMFADKNGLGMVMSLGLITLMILFIKGRGLQRGLIGCAFVLSLILLLGSNSISALFVLVGVALLGLVAWGFQSKRFGMMFVVGMSVLGIAIVIFGFLGLDSGDIFGMFGRKGNLTGRTEMWPYLIAAVQDRPLLGFGYNTFFQDESLATEYLAGFIAEYNWLPPHAHDSFIQISLDSGLIGLSSFIVVLLVSLRRAIAYFMAQKGITSLWPFTIIACQALGSYDETYFAQANTIQWILFVAAVLYARQTVPLRAVRPSQSSFEVAQVS